MWSHRCGLAAVLATAISYAELSKLYPGLGRLTSSPSRPSSTTPRPYRFARIAKFMTGWPATFTTGCIRAAWWGDGDSQRLSAQPVLPQYLQWFHQQSPSSCVLFCVGFAFGVAYIAFRGVTGTTGVNVLSTSYRLPALLVFSVMAISYRFTRRGLACFQLVNGIPVDYNVMQEPVLENGKPKLDPAGQPMTQPKMDDDGMPVPEMKDGKALSARTAYLHAPSRTAPSSSVMFPPTIV